MWKIASFQEKLSQNVRSSGGLDIYLVSAMADLTRQDPAGAWTTPDCTRQTMDLRVVSIL